MKLLYVGLVASLMVGAIGAPCTPPALATPSDLIQISHASLNEGKIYDMIVTIDFIYLSMYDGERVKIDRTS